MNKTLVNSIFFRLILMRRRYVRRIQKPYKIPKF